MYVCMYVYILFFIRAYLCMCGPNACCMYFNARPSFSNMMTSCARYRIEYSCPRNMRQKLGYHEK